MESKEDVARFTFEEMLMRKKKKNFTSCKNLKIITNSNILENDFDRRKKNCASHLCYFISQFTSYFVFPFTHISRCLCSTCNLISISILTILATKKFQTQIVQFCRYKYFQTLQVAPKLFEIAINDVDLKTRQIEILKSFKQY